MLLLTLLSLKNQIKLDSTNCQAPHPKRAKRVNEKTRKKEKKERNISNPISCQNGGHLFVKTRGKCNIYDAHFKNWIFFFVFHSLSPIGQPRKMFSWGRAVHPLRCHIIWKWSTNTFLLTSFLLSFVLSLLFAFCPLCILVIVLWNKTGLNIKLISWKLFCFIWNGLIFKLISKSSNLSDHD